MLQSCRALVPTHLDRAPDQSVLQLLIHAHTFLLFSKKQSAGRDRRLGHQSTAQFYLTRSPEASLGPAAQSGAHSLADASQLLLPPSMQLTP